MFQVKFFFVVVDGLITPLFSFFPHIVFLLMSDLQLFLFPTLLLSPCIQVEYFYPPLTFFVLLYR